MARRIFAAGTVTSIGAPQVLRFYMEATGGRPETDIYTVDASSYPDVPIPNGRLVTTAAGAYSAFAGPEDIEELWYERTPGGTRTKLTAGAAVTGATALAATAGHTHTGLSVQAAGTASVRAIGSTSTTAAAGDHAHAAQTVGAAKAALTSRAETTTTAADPDLTVALTAGTWVVDAVVLWTQTVSIATNAVLKSELAYSGTATSAVGYAENTAAVLARVAVADLTAGGATSATTGGTTANVLDLHGVVVVTDAGNLAFKWSQNVSATDPTTVDAGSFITATKIA